MAEISEEQAKALQQMMTTLEVRILDLSERFGDLLSDFQKACLFLSEGDVGLATEFEQAWAPEGLAAELDIPKSLIRTHLEMGLLPHVKVTGAPGTRSNIRVVSLPQVREYGKKLEKAGFRLRWRGSSGLFKATHIPDKRSER